MKILFLDIDGVLNSVMYEPKHTETEFQFIDETRMPLLKKIIDETNAKIVLSSTWRDCWNKDFYKCDKDGKYLTKTFAKYGLSIFDTTNITPNYYNRPREISIWLADTNEFIESYAILDDDEFDWGYHKDHVAKTFPRTSHGLEEEQVKQVVNELNKNSTDKKRDFI